ncbi:subtilisin like protease [Purpureocillium lavendulum]|uniref:Subtilisin like protease n=1 Tax=Purpureocillium lavendulum TaxID=1247861 RepID=A0AB34FA28_9HYPO|nr:subtilisin like protease [Purpureocillium lavendulum]
MRSLDSPWLASNTSLASRPLPSVLRIALVAALLSLAGLAALSHAVVARDYANNDYYVLHIDRRTPAAQVAARLGLEHEGQLGELADHHVFRSPKADHDVVRRELRESRRRKRDVGGRDVLDGVLLSTKQEARMRLEKRVIPPAPRPPAAGALAPRAFGTANTAAVQQQSRLRKTLDIADPIFTEQWHLFNTVELGHDVNVTGLWLEGITGKNATVAIVDDGIDMHSRDLRDNYFAAGSWDFNDPGPEPKPRLSDDRHGTRCAGEVSAVRNDVCGVGVAYDSKIAGIRILSKPISDADEAEAMIYKYQDNQIYSCSWGPHDDGRSMEAPGVLIRRAMLQGIQKGRGGLGSIYVFASGNGAANDDNCNFDGYTNSIYSITVGAVDRAGKHPYYSEHCSANLVVTYSSGNGDSIHTTDVGENKCATGHGGTSAAAALAAGIFALVMQVRSDLTWRDLQYLAMDTAKPVADTDAAWQKTAIGKQFSQIFGYGKIDSYALVDKAKTWQKVKPQAWYFSPWLHIKKFIPEGQNGLIVDFEVTEDMLRKANLARLEHVTVTMNVEHTRRGDLSVDLISPAKVVSHIATARKDDEHPGGYNDWTFMSVAHWSSGQVIRRKLTGESGVGKWTLVVRDTKENTHNGTFVDWHLKLWGESIDADKTTLLPLPNADDDADHDKISSTVTAPAATSTVSVAPEPTHQDTDAKPSDHPERPTKPGVKPEPTPTGDAQAETTTAASSWIDKFPTFGASKTARIWIGGALGLIIVFCIGLGVYLWVARRRRLRNSPRDDYEFELLDEEERDGLNPEQAAAAGKKGRRTRGGELYDAFAMGSDDDDEFDDYHDRSAERLAGVDEADQYVVGEETDDDDEGASGTVDEKAAERQPLGQSRRE